jgi:hypothetical protein
LFLETIEQIYGQNRINAFIFESITLIAFLGMGFFRNYSFFEMPAAVSIVTLLTIISMLFSALISWFHRWAYSLIIGVLFGMSYLSTITPFFKYTSYAIGLDYKKSKRTEYTIENISKNGLDSPDYFDSKVSIYQMLENWKNNQGIKKPKLVILNTSGGGSRSALWTMVVISNCDQALQNKLSNRLQLIAGASGPDGLGKALAGLAGAGLAIWGMESLFSKLESDSASEKKKQGSKNLVAPTTINPMTGAVNGDGSTTPGHGGLIGTMARVGIGMSKVGEFREEFGKNMADSLAQIAKNTGTTNDLLDLRKQTFGGGALGRLGATAVEMREANGGGGLAAGTGRIPNTLIPYNIDLERGVKKIFAAEYRTQAVNLMRRI